MADGLRALEDAKCAHCGGLIEIRNPSGSCDHLYWPDMLTDEAKIANGFGYPHVEPKPTGEE